MRFEPVPGIRQRHTVGDRAVLAGQREVFVIVTQATLPQGRLSQWKEHHPDHGGSVLLCKIYLHSYQQGSLSDDRKIIMIFG